MSESTEPNNPQQSVPDADQLELKLPDESSALKDLALWAGVLVLLTLVTYWPSADGSFLWRDDRTAMSRQFVGAGALPRIWTQRWDAPTEYGQPVYQPVALTAYWLEYQLGGHNAAGAPTPMAYHIASLIFHAGAAILLWLVLRELKLPGGWLVAGLFALHPLHAETVCWISEQPMVLAGLFFFGCIYTYLLFIRFLDRDTSERATGGAGVDPAQTWGLFTGSIVLCVLALLTHPAAAVLPLVVLLLTWWQQRFNRRDGAVFAVLFVVGLVLWFKNVDLLNATALAPPLIKSGLGAQIKAVGQSEFHTLFKLILPTGLSVLYPTAESAMYLVLPALIGLLAILLFIRRQSLGRGGCVAVVIFAMLAKISIDWFDSSRLSTVTDESAYLAIVPLLVIAVSIVIQQFARLKTERPTAAIVISSLLLLVLGFPAWIRAHAFESPVTFWTDTLAHDPDSVLAETSLAEQLRLQAMVDSADQNKDAMDTNFAAALDHAKAALKLDPQNSQAQHTWASVLVSQGDDAGAVIHFDAALQSDPDNAQILNEYGSALITLGRFQQAVVQLNRSLASDPASSTTHRLLGQAYFGLGNADRAIIEEQTALGINFNDLLAREELAKAQEKAGKLKEAIESYAIVMADPVQQNRADLWMAVAKIKDRQGDYDLAVQYMQTAKKLAHDIATENPANTAKDEEIGKLLAVEMQKQARGATTRKL